MRHLWNGRRYFPTEREITLLLQARRFRLCSILDAFTPPPLTIMARRLQVRRVRTPMHQRIKANAEMTIQQLRPLSRMDFGYTRESVEWLEGYIERLRQSGEFATNATKD